MAPGQMGEDGLRLGDGDPRGHLETQHHVRFVLVLRRKLMDAQPHVALSPAQARGFHETFTSADSMKPDPLRIDFSRVPGNGRAMAGSAEKNLPAGAA
ncbi:hypothetical protein Pve01_05850 [Planomonospora venezuelensis]|nr:hypothetical protein Pve01_05850 [Planomonospora venezuelensis]